MTKSDILIKKIQVANSLNKYQLAIKLAKNILANDPNNVTAYYYLSLANFNLDNIEEAKKNCEIGLSLEPNSDVLLLVYSAIAIMEQNYKFGLEATNKVLETDPINTLAIYFRACCYEKLKQYREAEFCSKELIKLEPNNALAHCTLADVYSETNQRKIAEQEYLEALRLEPNNYTTLNNYGLHLLKYNWYSKTGIELLKSSLRNNPNEKTVISNYKKYFILQNFFIYVAKAYKNVFETFLPNQDYIFAILASSILFYLGETIYLKICFILFPFYILYLITFLIIKDKELINLNDIETN